ncbi:serine hydrolase [Thermus filiformis]|uniref:Beta lactamase n=1 Tax=Thermus filiformis TaxID=276 RepID=A0A0A2WT23_THEFI|nr:serine hydrolase [Thermus filiformis]KGQ21922.1 beta lactamase [Thermus filiformis]
MRIARSLALVLLVTLAFGQMPSPLAALERLFTVRPAQAEWFSASFLQQVPVALVDQVISTLEAQLGRYLGVRAEDNGFVVSFEKGEVPAVIALDSDGHITQLLFLTPRPRFAGLEQALAGFRELPGKVSLLVLRNGQELAGLNPDEPLAVGSSFKLAILNALWEAIKAGKHAWSEVVELRPQWKSLPTGILQDWPEGSPITLHTLAALMISLSDNTASDALLSVLGREQVERWSGQNRPLLSTREAFVLKNPANHGLLERYLRADEVARRRLLPELDQLPLPPPTLFTGGPVAPEVEWFFSTRELCRLIEGVADLPIMAINPGPVQPKSWQKLAYKGGSEPGVINLTAFLTSHQGHRYCVSATWNDRTVLDEAHFISLYSGLLEILAGLQ